MRVWISGWDLYTRKSLKTIFVILLRINTGHDDPTQYKAATDAHKRGRHILLAFPFSSFIL